MKTMLLAMACAIPLAACGSKPAVDEKNASVEQVANSVREASRGGNLVRPGKWVSSVSIDQISMPGMPPEAVEQMKKMMAGTHQTETCLTEEEAKQPKTTFFAGNDQCRYDHFTMGDGKIDAEMHCSQGGTTQAMTMNGTYSPESYDMHMKSTTEGGPAGHAMNMEMTVKSKRIGECTAKET
jgi:hypothetical protein